MASGVGLHLSVITSFFQDNVSSFPKKMRAVKPESIRNKTDKPTSHKTVYTFFETLNDSTMTQYVDLEGKLNRFRVFEAILRRPKSCLNPQ